MNGSGLSAEIKPVRAGEQVYRFMQKAIVEGEFKAGEPIDTTYVTSLLNISRMPLRDALSRLETEGWVERQINGRVVVSEISLRELMDFYAVRSVLEGLLVKEATSHITDADLLEIEAQLSLFTVAVNENVSAEVLVETGEKLHSLIYQRARNEVCKHILDEINTKLARYRVYTAAARPGRFQETLNEHMEIIALIREKKADEAEAAMRRHIIRAGEQLRLVSHSKMRS